VVRGTSVLCKGQHTTEQVSFTELSLLRATARDEQLVREQRGLAAPTGMVSRERSMIPRQVGAVASPARSQHAM